MTISMFLSSTGSESIGILQHKYWIPFKLHTSTMIVVFGRLKAAQRFLKEIQSLDTFHQLIMLKGKEPRSIHRKVHILTNKVS